MLAGGAARADSLVYMTSLDWPPYTMANEPHGAVEEVVRQAFKAVGHTLVVDYLPWNRAVFNAKNDSHYVGYFPEYYSSEIARDFVFSRPVGSGPLGFAERKAEPMNWSTLDDLAGITIGTVLGYVNTEEFDRRAKAGGFKIEPTQSDPLNLRKLQAGRVRLAVIDRNVMSYLIKNDPALSGTESALQFNQRLLESKDLYVCFRNDEAGRRMAALFNDGLARIDAKSILDKRLNGELR
ncbi:MAG: transporter substrate-binding domain-containing protein [Magnetospirillum sp.]|nr:transporter substrate-binding domain-containing protein [Magnetospirillum sp.]